MVSSDVSFMGVTFTEIVPVYDDDDDVMMVMMTRLQESPAAQSESAQKGDTN